METTAKRVLVARLPRMDQEIVEAIVADEPGIVVVAVGGDSPPDAGEEADFLVLGGPEVEAPAAVARFLEDNPVAKVLVLGPDRRGYLYELHPRRSALGEVSPQLLLDVLRGTVPRARPLYVLADHAARHHHKAHDLA